MQLRVGLRARQSQVFRLGQHVSLLEMTAADLDDHLSKLAQENPMLILRPRSAVGMNASDALEMAAVEQPNGLYDHVFRELAGLIAHGGGMERLIMALICELEPSGWLGRAPSEMADSLGIRLDLVDTALRVVQKRIDPAGLFARDLEDCLRLQLEDRGAMTETMHLVLTHLPVLEFGGVNALAAETGLEPDKVQESLAILRQLDPKPGTAFASDPTLNREPDVRITRSGDGWEIEFLSCLRRDLEILQLPRCARTPETSQAIANAQALKQALDIRNSALRQVVGKVVDRQGAFFRLGDRALVPMTQSEIAQETGFHLSTVSRVLKGLLIEGPNGIFDARSLFSGASSTSGTHSKPQVQARIRELLKSEDPTSPISDRRLTALLQAEGVAVSRRVVSNYRQEIGILAAANRRLRA
ncbi:RNA polymerase subunit sigma-54 [Marivita sp.]|uniref:RNA polymerase factor sigma-54 n=1 Tax=Marivita sp. TaxID=2003365 RepID=UPI002638D93F|nr:RNA polymerase subunit sigma-54 [Marivita sp.]